MKSLIGTGIFFSIYSHTTSILYLSWAEIGIMGAPSATVPSINRRICSCCSCACVSLIKSILFCKIKTCFSFMISMAAKCSDVCGWGQDSLPAEKKLEQLIILHQSPNYMVLVRPNRAQQTKLKIEKLC